MRWELTPLSPSDGIRWAVGGPTGPRAATWRFWGNKKGDFYLAVRSLGGVLKTSLHRDGRCQTGLTSEYAERKALEGSRHWDRWKLPDAPLVNAVQVVTPVEELAIYRADDAEPMRWLPAPGPESVTVASVFVLPTDKVSQLADSWPAAADGAQPIGVISSATRTAFVVHVENLVTPQQRKELQEHRQRIAAAAMQSAIAPAAGLRTVLVGHDESGRRFLLDMAYRGELPGAT